MCILPELIRFALRNSTFEQLKIASCSEFNQATCGGTLSTIRTKLTNLFDTKYDTKFLPIKPQPKKQKTNFSTSIKYTHLLIKHNLIVNS